MPIYETGDVRIHYEEAGSGFPLLIIPGGGLNATISYVTGSAPFNPFEAFKSRYRCISLDPRNANAGQSSDPLEVDRPWDAHTDDQHVSRPFRFRVYRVARFRAVVSDAGFGAAGRCPGASLRRRHGVSTPRAEVRSEPVSLERSQGTGSPDGAPHSFLPPREWTGNGDKLRL
jgi:hypothetical protein